MNDLERCRIVERFRHTWPESEFGPAHIIIADGNLESEHLAWCDGIVYAVQEERKLGGRLLYPEHGDLEIEATRLLLFELRNGMPQTRLNTTMMDWVVTRWEDISQDDDGR